MNILGPTAGEEEVCERFGVSRESRKRLGIYVRELERWNRRINLVGPKTIGQVWTRHVADALQLIPLLPEGTRGIVDLGSGGGVPGLVLALALAGERDIHMTLVESNAKKAAFLRQVAQKAGVRVNIINQRIEHLDPADLGAGPDMAVTARALAPLPELLELSWPLLRAGAVGIFLKGQDVERELTEATRYWKIKAKKVPSITDEKAEILIVEEARRV